MQFTGLVLSALLLLGSTSALAQSTGTDTAGSRDGRDGNVSAELRAADGTISAAATGIKTVGTAITGPGLPAWLRECRWEQMTNPDFTLLVHSQSGVAGTVAVSDSSESWMVVLCPSGPEADLAAGNRWWFAATGILAAWQIGEAPPQRFLDWIVARSYASVALPVQVGDAAPFGDDDAPLITQLPTWLWIADDIWQPVSVTPAPVFGVTATVTATPRRVTFTNGKDIVDCGANIGGPYDFDLDEDQQHSECTLTYHHSSAVTDWTLTSTVSWAVTYTCSAYCGSGALPDLVIQNTRDVRVAEILAVAKARPAAALAARP